MTIFFVSPEQIKKPRIILTGPDVTHITCVLRSHPGDTLVVSDGCVRGYRIRLDKVNRQEVEGIIEEEFILESESPVHVTLVQSLPKSDKMDLIIQKCTELGVKEFIPLLTKRAIPRLAEDKIEKRVARWQKIALEAAKQCQRAQVPKVKGPLSLEEFLPAMPVASIGIMPWEEEKEINLKQVLKKTLEKNIFLFIGPEGGFEQEEVELARNYHVVTVSLGKRILRTETAALATVTMVLYETGDLGG